MLKSKIYLKIRRCGEMGKKVQEKKKLKQESITVKKNTNFSEWYREIIIKSELADYSEVSGCIVFRPLAYAIWERIRAETEKRLKKIGIETVYFPLFIPEKLLSKEAEHVDGFSPEVAWVTEAGNSKLKEKLAIRPTSETIMYPSYAKWIRSWRDLPLRLNQWNNVVRWEFKHPTPFLRSREFLWNEGHTVFATKEEAESERNQILGIYQEITSKYLALPGILGKKSHKEKFAGAVASYSIEHLMPDGKAIQGPDFHNDGQNFSKAFDITFIDQNNNKQYAWQNTWAITTREIGVMVAVHSDDKGLILPPKVAPTQVIIIPILTKQMSKKQVLDEAKKIEHELECNLRVKLDDRSEYTPGWKFNEWELKGVPLRVEIGPRDIVKKQVIVVRRDTGQKKTVNVNDLFKEIVKDLNSIQKDLYSKAQKILQDNTHKVNDYTEFTKILHTKGGILQVCWCGEISCEELIKEKTSAKITNIPFEQGKLFSDCIYCGKKAKMIVNFAKSY
jgi:prolyl-tRNA synthetase